MTALAAAGGLALIGGAMILTARLAARHRRTPAPPVEPATTPHGIPTQAGLPPIPTPRTVPTGDEDTSGDTGEDAGGRHRREDALTGSFSATAMLRRLNAEADALPDYRSGRR